MKTEQDATPYRIDDLIADLQKLRQQHGNAPVRVQTLTHNWPPEPTVRTEPITWILLNP
jgi:hypothetical protein